MGAWLSEQLGDNRTRPCDARRPLTRAGAKTMSTPGCSDIELTSVVGREPLRGRYTGEPMTAPFRGLGTEDDAGNPEVRQAVAV